MRLQHLGVRQSIGSLPLQDVAFCLPHSNLCLHRSLCFPKPLCFCVEQLRQVKILKSQLTPEIDI